MMSSNGNEFPPDKTWGTVFTVLYSLMLIVAIAFITGMTALFSFAPVGPNGHSMPLFGAAFAAVAGFIVIASLGVHIVCSIGIVRSRAWGFWATIAVSAVSLLSSGGGTCLTIVPLVYSIVRLSGSFGPKPS